VRLRKDLSLAAGSLVFPWAIPALVTPGRVLQSNFGFACMREFVETRAAKEKNPAIGLLCSNREVTAGELAEKKQQRQNLPFFPPGV
jgi:hypothetical protein